MPNSTAKAWGEGFFSSFQLFGNEFNWINTFHLNFFFKAKISGYFEVWQWIFSLINVPSTLFTFSVNFSQNNSQFSIAFGHLLLWSQPRENWIIQNLDIFVRISNGFVQHDSHLTRFQMAGLPDFRFYFHMVNPWRIVILYSHVNRNVS